MLRLRDSLIDHLVLIVATILLVVAAMVGVNAYRNGEQFGANISTELASIAITVIVIDQLYQIRSRREYKLQIIDQIGSEVNDAAMEAVRVARQHGWLKNGSVAGIDLTKANLQNAEMIQADLKNTVLQTANLQNANLHEANLEARRSLEFSR